MSIKCVGREGRPDSPRPLWLSGWDDPRGGRLGPKSDAGDCRAPCPFATLLGITLVGHAYG